MLFATRLTTHFRSPIVAAPMTADADDKPLAPEQERLVRQVRRVAIGSSVIMLLGFAVVISVIGYRLFAAAERAAPPAESAILLPKGARVLSTTVSDGKIAVTIELSGAVEVRFYELATLRPTGRIRFATEP
jgi:multidrug efflux pump subunit AcrA (membrane-fusion protein)